MLDRYLCPQINEFWTQTYRYRTLYRISMTHLVETRLLPIEIDANVINDDTIADILNIESVIKHDINAFVQWLEKHVTLFAPEAARFVHYGLTSSDLVDTCLSIQLKRTNTALSLMLVRLSAAIAHTVRTFDREHKISMVGRTHSQWAEPINPLIKYDQICAVISMLVSNLNAAPCYGKLSGSLGDNKYLTPEKEESIIRRLGLRVGGTQGQIVSRSYYNQIHHTWVQIAAFLGKIIIDLRLLAQPEINEITLSQPSEVTGSSSMPHKVNPIALETMTGLISIIKAHHIATTDIVSTWHERDISNSSVERIIYPMDANLLGYIIEKLTDIFKNLKFNAAQIILHHAHAGDSLYSQAEMLKYIDSGMSRLEAYEKMKEKYRLTN